MPQDRHRQRIAHEQGFNACVIQQFGGGIVVSGKHGKGLLAILELLQAFDGDFLWHIQGGVFGFLCEGITFRRLVN